MKVLSERSGSALSLSNAMRDASGDQTDHPLFTWPLVSWCSAVRSGLEVHTCQNPLWSCRMNVRRPLVPGVVATAPGAKSPAIKRRTTAVIAVMNHAFPSRARAPGDQAGWESAQTVIGDLLSLSPFGDTVRSRFLATQTWTP